jgi:dTDP-4-dehydrorhamnose reductase
MRLLILGGSGLIGNSIIKDNIKKNEIISTFKTNPILFSDIKSLYCSLPEDLDKLEKIILKEKPGVLINTVGYSNVDYCEINQDKANLLHVEITKKIYDICNKTKTKLIFLSSDYVFGGKKGKYTETDELNPINHYGVTKQKAEEIVLRNPNNTVVRTSFIYDWGNNVRFFNYVINNLQKNTEITAINDLFSCFTLMDNLTQSIFRIIELNKTGIFHVVDSTCINKFEFAKKIAEVFDLDKNLIKGISIDETEAIAKRPKDVCLDNSKARKELDINFESVEKGLMQILKKSHLDL